MKGFALLLSVCFGVAVAQICEYDHGDGRPACIAAELNRPWRNNWDPVHYWVCLGLNVPAVAMRCPTDTGFLESALTCVPWTQWFWTQPCNPPSGGSNGGGGGGGGTTVTFPPISTTQVTPAPPGPGCEYDHGDGRPACIAVEMNRLWRNNWDPVHFWQCITLNTPAVAVRCPTDTGFLESAQRCVPWTEWFWTQPCNPPSGGSSGGGGGGGTVLPPVITTTTTPFPTTPINPGPTTPINPGPTGAPGWCYYDHSNGRPLCIAEEMNRPWRNNWDNTRYWLCQTQGVPAVTVLCGVNSLYHEPSRACINVHAWQWTPPCNPPSTTPRI